MNEPTKASTAAAANSTSVPRFRDAQKNRSIVHPHLPQQEVSHLQGSHHHTFVVTADTQLGMTERSLSWELEVQYSEQAVQAINNLQPRPLFCCVCGDLIESSVAFLAGQTKPSSTTECWTVDECDALQEAQNKEFQRIWRKLHPDIALVCLCGNHDVGNRPTKASIDRFTSSYGDDYLGFWANKTYNIVLNSNLFNDPSGAKENYEEQLAWFKDRLEYANNAEARQIFLFSHHPWFLYDEDEEADSMHGKSPYYEAWGEGSIPDGYFHIPKGYRDLVLQLCKRFHVTAAFSGHFHQNLISKTSFGMDMIVTGPLSVVIQSTNNPSTEPQTQGYRLVEVTHQEDGSSSFQHKFVALT